ncbi:MAG: NADH-quinone oxidoreductase subunit C [Bacteroidota bacterium]
MTNEEIKQLISQYVPSASFEEGGVWMSVLVDSCDWLPLAEALRNHSQLDFDYLFCVTGVDWKTHLSVVYHLSSKKLGHTVVVKVKISDRDKPAIETVSGIWRTAELNEREVYDLFGVRFINHPDLRRLFLKEDWKGWPLRKDYEDPVNMIKL